MIRYTIKKKIVKHIYEYVNMHFQSDNVELCQYISENLEQLIIGLNASADDFEIIINECTDNTSETYLYDFVPKFNDLCDGKNNRLVLSCFEGSYIIGLNEYARNYDNNQVEHYCTLLQKLCEKGEHISSSIAYEQFCQKWFSEFCVEVHTTPKNDKGIDLEGIFENIDKLSQITSHNEIHMLAQIKLYKNLVDTPAIRKFIGDVLFLTFEDGDTSVFSPTVLFFVGHQGFTEAAKRFGNKHNVILLNSRDLVRILSCKGNLKNFECIQFLDEIELQIC